MKQPLNRLWHPDLLIAGSLAAVLLLAFSAQAQPAPPSAAATVQEASPAAESLDLPSFKPKTKPKPKSPVKLELLPEAEIPAAEVVPPVVVPAAEPLVTASPALSTEPYGPPAPPASAEPEVTQGTIASELFGPPAPASSEAEVAAGQLAPTDPAADVIKDGWQEGSLMFSKAELQKLREALLAPPPTVETAPVPGAPPGTPRPPVVDYAVFHVNSIIYHGTDQWSVWLNGRKFFPGKDSPLERVTLDSVSDNSITFHWKPANKIAIPDEFDRNHVRPEGDGSIAITLSANQTLLTKWLVVMEGRGMTQEIRALIAGNTAKAQLAIAAAVPPGSPANTAPAANVDPALSGSNDAHDRNTVDKLVSQYREAEVKNAEQPNPPPVAAP